MKRSERGEESRSLSTIRKPCLFNYRVLSPPSQRESLEILSRFERDGVSPERVSLVRHMASSGALDQESRQATDATDPVVTKGLPRTSQLFQTSVARLEPLLKAFSASFVSHCFPPIDGVDHNAKKNRSLDYIKWSRS